MSKRRNNFLRNLAVLGNLFFIFWIFFNGYNERFADTFGQIVRYALLMGLLGVNILLLIRKPRRMYW
jgi:hypothetical protein